MRRPGSTDDHLWYKDAIIYELHVRSFFDSSDDGTGDFQGLTRKLDYLQDLGVTCLWLLPFYPSPLKDDGYDIASYDDVHPAYGTLKDFKQFLREAHLRKIQVITELVVNHTSDQHPWFQAARRAPLGSSKRGFYVWSETNRKYEGARIIFTDTERSNWTWDNEAGAYYWHRFFYHQPDLNFDNPRVLKAMIRAMRFWLDLGVDGMRLDAVPYLIEREGTNCENLPETHEVLRRLRREVDERYGNRMLLAEANQWPADVRFYMGNGDECHMAFHFPLMPRIFMALRQEDRYPITEILDQTPDIPGICQWALFLRNHDELTLEMVTDEERDYMYRAYAADPQMRLNMGIRRRLAPLMENNRQRIQLLNGLLFSLPGTPIIYYGDEIGMGDNIYLGDRNGVRTPMQWTGDRNAGFSRADPARLFAPPIMDAVYGYQAINVEAQERSPYSLLNWMKRMVALRKEHPIFGRGAIRFIPVRNRKVLAYVRYSGNQVVLAVANLSRTVQPAELDLGAYEGLVPMEMLGRTEFPAVSDRPYFLTLGPYSFYWFELVKTPAPILARLPEPLAPEPTDEAPALLAGGAWETILEGNVRRLLERDYLAAYLQRQRWFGGKSRAIAGAEIADWGLLRQGPEPVFATIVDVRYEDGGRETYFAPVGLKSGTAADEILRQAPEAVVARLKGARKGVMHDASAGEEPAGAMLTLVAREGRVPMKGGMLSAYRTAIWQPDSTPGALPLCRPGRSGPEQSNTSFVYGDEIIMKLMRRVETGPNPEVEVQRHLAERRHFPRVPAFLGGLRYERTATGTADLAILQTFVKSQATGWEHAVEEVRRFFDRATSVADMLSVPRPPLDQFAAGEQVQAAQPVVDTLAGYLVSARLLGERTAGLHSALADPDAPEFSPEPLDTSHLLELQSRMSSDVQVTLDLLNRHIDRLPAADVPRAEALLSARARLVSVFEQLSSLSSVGSRIRVHGDLHLGQTLWAAGDVVFLDFEGEPMRPLEERRGKHSPLKDVAGMMRSFAYASGAALMAQAAGASERDRLRPLAAIWHTWVGGLFLNVYRSSIGPDLVPGDSHDFTALLRSYLLEKALYELRYELGHRPDWVGIPLSGLVELIDPELTP
ncbi:MAG: maltose alpha-D-glucosyltransferase [Vicinamibacterales bacterium]